MQPVLPANNILPQCDIIVPAFNPDYATLELLIQTLINQGAQEKQILIIDDKSSVPIKLDKFPLINIHRLNNNLGPAQARNIGINLTSNPYIVFIDSDCIPSDNWLAYITKGIQEDNIAAITGPYDKPSSPGVITDLEYNFSRSNQLNRTQFTDYLTTANLIIKRVALPNTNVFQSLNSGIFKWRNYYNEDGQLTNYIRKNGLNVKWDERAKVIHHKKFTLTTLTIQQTQFVWGIIHSNSQSEKSATPVLRKKLVATIPSILMIVSLLNSNFLYASLISAAFTKPKYYKNTFFRFPLNLVFHLYIPIIWISVGTLSTIEILILKILKNKK